MENQDSWIAHPLRDGGLLVAVADGIGGAPGGRQASQLAISAMAQGITAGADWPQLSTLMHQANRQVYDEGRHRPDLFGMGTTLTTAIFWENRVYVAHVGDSRAYRLTRHGMDQCTEDHSVAAEMERVGSLSRDEAAHHPQRHVLTRAIGPFESIRVDSQILPWSPLDRLLLCTDGLYNALDDSRIFEICQRLQGQAAVDSLLQAALMAGGPDNVTVVLVESGVGLV